MEEFNFKKEEQWLLFEETFREGLRDDLRNLQCLDDLVSNLRSAFDAMWPSEDDCSDPAPSFEFAFDENLSARSNFLKFIKCVRDYVAWTERRFQRLESQSTDLWCRAFREIATREETIMRLRGEWR